MKRAAVALAVVVSVLALATLGSCDETTERDPITQTEAR